MQHQHEQVSVSSARSVESEPGLSWREQRFNTKEVSEILSIATRLQNEGIKGEQILQMAEEAGIAPEFVERAVIEFQKRKWQRIEAALQLRHRLRWLLGLGSVLIVLTGVSALALISSFNTLWSYAASDVNNQTLQPPPIVTPGLVDLATPFSSPLRQPLRYQFRQCVCRFRARNRGQRCLSHVSRSICL